MVQQLNQHSDKDFNAGSITERLLKYGVTVKYAAGMASEISHLENYCRAKFISKAELDDVIKHYFVRIEAKLNAARVESLRWYIGMSFVHISMIIAVLELFK